MEVDSLREFGLMFLAGLLVALLCYGYNMLLKPTLVRAGLDGGGCGCGG